MSMKCDTARHNVCIGFALAMVSFRWNRTKCSLRFSPGLLLLQHAYSVADLSLTGEHLKAHFHTLWSIIKLLNKLDSFLCVRQTVTVTVYVVIW